VPTGAERATRWNCSEVLSACVKQRDDLAAYRTAVTKAVARLFDPSSPTVTARNINTAYLQFFLPFWTEHILGKARLKETAAAKEVNRIMTEPPVVTNLPAAHPPSAPTPSAYIPPANYYYPPPPPACQRTRPVATSRRLRQRTPSPNGSGCSALRARRSRTHTRPPPSRGIPCHPRRRARRHEKSSPRPTMCRRPY
jgi:hypothetical protein